jgi:preprotein translocase subunit SecF
MLRIVRDTNIDFIGQRTKTLFLSSALIVVGLISLISHGGLRMGVDFTGGVQVEVGINPADGGVADIAEVRDAVARAGYDNRNIQRLGGEEVNNFLIHLQETSEGEDVSGTESAIDASATTSARILDELRNHFGGSAVSLRGVESVGPKIGAELRGAAVQAVLLALLLVVIYVAWRFEFRFGVATLVAVGHDVLVVVGLFSLFNKEMTLSIVAALLTLVGYSVNDTIVVFDRIREELKKKQRRDSVASIFNSGINHTLSRTLLTSLTTLLVVLALFVYGGSVIHDFAWVLLIGIIVGTYSSIFVAAPLVVEWQRRVQMREAAKST